MKLVLGAALLLALFALGLALQRHWRSEALAEREQARLERERAEDGGAPGAPGWSRVVVGAPSGAVPAPAAAPAVAPSPSSAPSNAPASSAPPPAAHAPEAAHEFELVVALGQTLSSICKEHYQSARTEVVEALARYNGLDKPDALREGQKLRLPPLERLLAKKP